MINDPNLVKLSEIISCIYGPNPSIEILNTINSYQNYYLSNLDSFPQLFANLVQCTNPHLNFWIVDQLILIVNLCYNSMSIEQRDKFRQLILKTIKHSINSIYQLTYIANKFCFLIITWLKYDFPDDSQLFFKELINNIASVSNNEDKMKRVVIFLDILLAFDEELIKDRHTYTKFEAEKSTIIKDYMRINNIAEISFLVTQIIDNEQYFDQKIVSKTIRLIAQLIDWNQLNIFEVAIEKILKSLIQKNQYQTECFELINALIKKGMDHTLKIQIIKQLKLLNFINDILAHTYNNEKLISIISETINTIGIFVLESYNLIKKAIKNGNNCDNEIIYINEFLIFCINGANKIININEIGYKCSLAFINFLSGLNSFLKIAENEIVQQTCLNSLKELIVTLGNSFIIPIMFDLTNGNFIQMKEHCFFVYRKEYNVIYSNFFCLKHLQEFYLDIIIKLFKLVQQNSNLHSVENFMFLMNSIVQGIKPKDIIFIQNQFAQIIHFLFSFPFAETSSDFILLSYYETLSKYLPYFIDNTSALDFIVKLYLSKKGIIYSNIQTGIQISSFFDKFIEKTKSLFMQAKHSNIVQEIISKLKEYIYMIIHSNNFYCIGQYEILFHSFSTVLSCINNLTERNQHFEEMLKIILSIFAIYGTDGEKFVEVCKCLTQLMNSITTEVKDITMKEMMINFYNFLITEYYNKISGDKNKKITYSMITILQRILIVLGSDSVKYIEFFLSTQFNNNDSIDPELFNDNMKLFHNTILQYKQQSKPIVAKFFNCLFVFTKSIELPLNNISDVEKVNLSIIGSFVKFVSLIFIDIPEVFIESNNIIELIDQITQYMIIISKNIIDESIKKSSARSLGNIAVFLIKTTNENNSNTNTTILTWILNASFEVYKKLDFSNKNELAIVKEIMRIHYELEKTGQFYLSYISNLMNAETTKAFIDLIHELNIEQPKLPENLMTGFNVRIIIDIYIVCYLCIF